MNILIETNPRMAAIEIDRISYPRIDLNRSRLNAEAIFLSDGEILLQQTDGWEPSWRFPPKPGEIEHVKGLRQLRVLMSSNSKSAARELDEELAFELLEVPEVCAEAMQRLRDLARQVVTQCSGNVFVQTPPLKKLHDDGQQAIEQFLASKRHIRAWLNKIADLQSELSTFDEREVLHRELAEVM